VQPPHVLGVVQQQLQPQRRIVARIEPARCCLPRQRMPFCPRVLSVGLVSSHVSGCLVKDQNTYLSFGKITKRAEYYWYHDILPVVTSTDKALAVEHCLPHRNARVWRWSRWGLADIARNVVL